MLPSIPGYAIDGVLHASPPRVVYTGTDGEGRPVVLKTLADRYPTRRAVAEIRHEYELMQRLDVRGVMPVEAMVEYGNGNLAIVMQPFGRSLAALLRDQDGEPLSWRVFYTLAVQSARILGDLHEAHVIHKDVVPRNLLADEHLEVRLIDFGIASELDSERQEAVLSKRLEGSLPYLSPEQTGRMNRDVDYRSDYYALGVTLFELATGRLPFDADGILEWVHRHISQPPPDPRTFRPDLPEALSAILAKLLAKDASERYQSTFGLIADLERCRDLHLRTGEAPAFPLATRDTSRRFEIPQRLFGRETELQQLRSAFDDVADGSTRLVTIHGFSGVGKSALVGELSRSIASEQGHLLQGKLDQFQRNTPYHAVSSAFGQLFRQILGERAETLETWRDRILAAVGPHGALLTDLVPELQLVIGEQPDVAALPPSEAQNRFQLVFTDFVRALTQDRPLVVFLDDLQWSDAPTLALLQSLLKARDLHRLLVIGAYRSNEVDDGHPLTLALDAIRAERPVLELALEPLAPPAVAALTAATVHTSTEVATPLCDLVLEKTGGNPFFARAFLRSLYDDGMLRFSPGAGRWVWDLRAARDADVGENVVAFMVGHLRRLPEATQDVLQLAAAIGNAFDFDTLALTHASTREATRAALDEALRLDMVVPLTEGYRYVALDRDGTGEAVNAWYRFQHDRVQQAAYALVPEERRAQLRLNVGRLLRSQLDAHPERLLEVVGHLNEGRHLLEDGDERRALAMLNLEAGRRARNTSAYAFAHEHLTIGLELLDGHEAPSLRWSLVEGLQETAYLTGRYDEADALSAELLELADSPVARAEVLSTRTRQYATVGRMHDSIHAAIQGLNLLGMEFEEDPDVEDLQAELAAVDTNLAGRAIPDLIDASACIEDVHLVATRLLMEIFAAAFLSGSGTLFPYLVARLVNLSLKHGNSPESAFAYAAYGMILCGKLDDPAQGYAFGRLGVALNEQFDDIALRSRVIYVYTMFVHHWTEPWATMTPWFQKGIEAGYQAGDLLYLAYSAQDCILWDPTLDLATASAQQRKYLSIVRDTGYRDSFDSGTLFLQLQLNLMGLTDSPTSMNTADFDEEATLAGMRERGFMTGIANHHIYKAEIHYTVGDIAGALAHVVAQDDLIASSMALPQIVRFHLVAFLTRSAWLTEHPDERSRLQPALDRSLSQMRKWAAHAPVNFAHLVAMMEGELHRLDGRLQDALACFEAAVTHGSKHQYLRDEALANELAGTCLSLAGLPKAAEGYIRAAAHGYEHFGANRKVLLMEQQHPWLVQGQTSTRLKTVSLSHTSGSMLGVELDMASVMKASRAISGELVLDQLWSKTLDVLIENAGAQTGAFVLEQDGELVLYAFRGAAARDLPHPLGDDAPVPVSLLRSVLRTREPVVLHDAREAKAWRDDPYLRRERPRSVLAIPIAHRGSFEGVIYLENRLTVEAFTEERIEILTMLSAQAAISTENARLYEDQSRLVQAQRRFVPNQFLENLGHDDIATVELGESVAREMTVLFSDLRGFTPLTERLGPRNVIALLNSYFSALEVPIAAAGGFIDSFNGDEIMALFGGSSDLAVRAGIGMWRALEQFNADSEANGGPVLKMGVGLNTGDLVLGTVGGRDRLKCGVVGDPVNLASRIEQLTKHYDVPFLIGENTFRTLVAPEALSLRQIDRVAVKGKTEGIRLYEVLDAETPERRAKKEATRPLLDEAFERYTSRHFAEAVDLLDHARSVDSADRVLPILRERCARYAETPPPPSWTGIETLSHK